MEIQKIPHVSKKKNIYYNINNHCTPSHAHIISSFYFFFIDRDFMDFQ